MNIFTRHYEEQKAACIYRLSLRVSDVTNTNFGTILMIQTEAGCRCAIYMYVCVLENHATPSESSFSCFLFVDKII